MLRKFVGRPRLFLTVLGLAALFGMLIVSDTAEAFRASTARVRAPRVGKLKKPAARSVRPQLGDPFPNITKVGLTCQDTGANGAEILAIQTGSAAAKTFPSTLDIGDIIVSVEDQRVLTCSDLDSLLGQAISIRLPNVLLGVLDGKTGTVGATLLDLRNLPQAVRAARPRSPRPQPR
jgi:S1-C subfamily serine protease